MKLTRTACWLLVVTVVPISGCGFPGTITSITEKHHGPLKVNEKCTIEITVSVDSSGQIDDGDYIVTLRAPEVISVLRNSIRTQLKDKSPKSVAFECILKEKIEGESVTLDAILEKDGNKVTSLSFVVPIAP
jgi:sRNA-binding carbon storage regulator CsrA